MIMNAQGLPNEVRESVQFQLSLLHLTTPSSEHQPQVERLEQMLELTRHMPVRSH